VHGKVPDGLCSSRRRLKAVNPGVPHVVALKLRQERLTRLLANIPARVDHVRVSIVDYGHVDCAGLVVQVVKLEGIVLCSTTVAEKV
jgi:hypothetical protein